MYQLTTAKIIIMFIKHVKSKSQSLFGLTSKQFLIKNDLIIAIIVISLTSVLKIKQTNFTKEQFILKFSPQCI